jgi:kynureninase
MKKEVTNKLASMRARFLLPEDVVYMNGNSLGPLSRDVRDRVNAMVATEWGEQLIRGWNMAGWYELPARLGNKIGQLIGAKPGETTICDSTSVNLYKAVSAAAGLRPGRRKILSEPGNFPTDLYILDGFAKNQATDYRVETVARSAIADAIDEDTAVVVLTHVHYVSGEVFPMVEITKRAHEAGALTVWDLSHSVGAVSLDLNQAKADFAVGCGYKHLNGGPGAPAFIFAAECHHASMQQPLSGWFGHANPFAFTDDYVAANGIRRMLTGTTGVIGASALEAAVDLFLEVDAGEYFQKSRQLSEAFQHYIDQECAGYGLELVSPKNVQQRGAHISYSHEHGYAIMQNLIARGVIGDFRAPHYLRFGISPMFLSVEDITKAVDVLRKILSTQSYLAPEFQTKHAVT